MWTVDWEAQMSFSPWLRATLQSSNHVHLNKIIIGWKFCNIEKNHVNFMTWVAQRVQLWCKMCPQSQLFLTTWIIKSVLHWRHSRHYFLKMLLWKNHELIHSHYCSLFAASQPRPVRPNRLNHLDVLQVLHGPGAITFSAQDFVK